MSCSIKLSILLALILLVGLVAPNTAAYATANPSCPLELLARVAGTVDFRRTPDELRAFLAYKHAIELKDPVALMGRGVGARSEWLGRSAVWMDRHFALPTIYEERVILLQQGDTVSFGDRHFTLEKFLGFGNATHVWSIKESSEVVLRVPLLVPGVSMWNLRRRAATQPNRLQIIRKLIGEYARKADKNSLLCPVEELGPQNSYMLVRRINGSETAFAYLRRELGKPHLLPGEVLFWDNILRDARVDRTENPKLQKLLQVLQANQLVIPVSDSYAINVSDLRQFLWDQSADNWQLIDVE